MSSGVCHAILPTGSVQMAKYLVLGMNARCVLSFVSVCSGARKRRTSCFSLPKLFSLVFG